MTAKFTRWLFAVLVAMPLAGAGEVRRLDDHEYRRVGEVSLKLDAFVPAGEGPFPVAMLIHGGGWGSGDKRADFGDLVPELEKAGIAWCSVSYRLAPEHRWPACFDDVQAALAWLRASADELRIDPQRIAVVGYSAGGQLASLLAIRTPPEEAPRAVVGLAPAVELVADSRRRGEVSKALRDLLDLSPELDPPALRTIAAISPAEQVRAGLPPFLLVQGTADESVRHEETISFSERLRDAKVECRILELEGAPHRIAEWTAFDAGYPAQVVAWLGGEFDRTTRPDKP